MSRSKEELDVSLEMVERMHAEGALEGPVRFKLLVSLAYEYLLAGEDQKAFQLLDRPSAEYYRDEMAEQMLADELFAELVVKLSYRLIQAGVVEDGPVLGGPVNMQGAKA